MISPPWFPVPPPAYGGIERVVADIVDVMVDMGHDVILLAPAGSQTKARLIPTVERHLTLDLSRKEMNEAWARTSSFAYRVAREEGVDVIHDHTDFPHGQHYPIPVVRTMHGPAVEELVSKYLPMGLQGDGFVAISARQAELYQEKVRELFGPDERLNIVGVVHNPVDISSLPFRAEKEDFVLFLGRCDWEKNPDGAIRVARAAGKHLVMALRVTVNERPYFERVVEPLLGPDVTLLGEITPQERDDWLARAEAVLFTSQWEEPFGLVMTEAMACGTPVLAFRRGAAPEVILHGETGFLCANEDEMAAMVYRVKEINPHRCRKHVEENFTPQVAARRYLKIYQTMTSN